ELLTSGPTRFADGGHRIRRGSLLPKQSMGSIQLSPSARERLPREEFKFTEQTEVTLDGRPCRYKDVPAGASILLIELAPDRTTILRIHVRARKQCGVRSAF